MLFIKFGLFYNVIRRRNANELDKLKEMLVSSFSCFFFEQNALSLCNVKAVIFTVLTLNLCPELFRENKVTIVAADALDPGVTVIFNDVAQFIMCAIGRWHNGIKVVFYFKHFTPFNKHIQNCPNVLNTYGDTSRGVSECLLHLFAGEYLWYVINYPHYLLNIIKKIQL